VVSELYGCWKYACMYFALTKLCMDDVLFLGFVNTVEVTLGNTSEVPMTYRLRVPSDGTKEALQDSKGSDTTSTAITTILVKEFSIRPRSGTIPPGLLQSIQVLTGSCLPL